MIFSSLGSVRKYHKGTVQVNISLPEQEPGCRHCYFLRCAESKGRYYCDITGEPLYRDQIAKQIGEFCPVEWEEDDESFGNL